MNKNEAGKRYRAVCEQMWNVEELSMAVVKNIVIVNDNGVYQLRER